LSTRTINAIRDLALEIEEDDIETANELMSLAHTARPSGAFMIKKLNEYHNKINPSTAKIELKKMFDNKEVAIIPIGFRCFTKIDIYSSLKISQPSLPFDSGFFTPASVASIIKNPSINLSYSNHSVCIKYENYYDSVLGLGIRFKTSTYAELNTLIANTHKDEIKQYLDGTYGYYTLDTQHNYVLAHYNWHTLASQSNPERMFAPEINIKNINETLNQRIKRMFQLCNNAKYIFFVFGEYQEYKYMMIDDHSFDLHNFKDVENIVNNTFSAKSFVVTADEFNDADMLLAKINH
jgi:hypothetical protein